MRILALACSAMIVAVLAVDPLVRRYEAARLEGLLGVPRISEPKEPGIDLLWAELGVGAKEIDITLGRGTVRPGSRGRGPSIKDHLQARDRLKGTIDHEDPESII